MTGCLFFGDRDRDRDVVVLGRGCGHYGTGLPDFEYTRDRQVGGVGGYCLGWPAAPGWKAYVLEVLVRYTVL